MPTTLDAPARRPAASGPPPGRPGPKPARRPSRWLLAVALAVLGAGLIVVTGDAPGPPDEFSVGAGEDEPGPLSREARRAARADRRAQAPEEGSSIAPSPSDGAQPGGEPSTDQPGRPAAGPEESRPGRGGAGPTADGSASGSTSLGDVAGPVPADVDPASLPEPIGYVGGSLTYNATDGYATVGGTKFWEGPDRAYGGGTVTAWAQALPDSDDDDRWEAFASLEATNRWRDTTRVVWFELLSHGGETDGAVYEAALVVLDEIRRRLPGATIYVSGMNGYTVAGDCSGVTAAAPPQMRALADRLVVEGRALAGPIMAELTPEQTTDGAGCHANSEGKRILGEELRAFFG